MSGDTVKTAKIIVRADGAEVALDMAQRLVALAQAKKEGIFRIALSGGSTPKKLFELLASPAFVARMPWERVAFYYGDERHVPHDDAASNYRMSCETLFNHVAATEGHVYPIPTNGTAEEDAASYQRLLQAHYGAQDLDPARPFFDVVMLGMGQDGHTASLFPRQPVLQEREKWVATCVPDDAPHTRITLTYPAIASSRHVVFLLEGKGKAEMFRRVRSGDDALPSSHVTTQGEMTFLCDKAVTEGVS
ncbi:6-phosphogluconolactonase [Candidatus Kirkpatrickella diaphorinae]|uniref:6-phosphogluconolactonase n=1 Tax=Candidatus Kirkpatrickella diaphorinae TaxID=2984322 RepID=A0ABY6GG91_9PROT|nr:6-phosphogluconolactonase [Candidatus Kirkpatrickella diaphorinae]UYH50508.1 6-phosphogluconolactonase [Candidatus Kirkpatrickella diaphorinae]